VLAHTAQVRARQASGKVSPSSLRVCATRQSAIDSTNLCLERDGHPASFKNVYLSNGASSGVNTLLHVICAKPETGILVPIPQYPLYTATLSVLDARCVPYYLDESQAWGTSLDSIKESYKTAIAEGTDVKAIVIINPGNPTGASLPAEDIRAVLEFAAEKGLVVMADEVYQTNVFTGEFISFKKALRDLQKEQPEKFDHLELASLHSISKGMVGECGHRGGYFELTGFDQQVADEIYKFVSIQLCPPVLGQCIVEMMVNPPKEGEPSYELYKKEYDGIFKGLSERANALYEAFKQMEGVECQSPAVRILLEYVLAKSDSNCRALCTSSPPSTSRKRPWMRQRRKGANPMNSTASACWTRQVSVLCLDLVSARRRARCTSALLSSLRVPSGLAGLSSSTRSLWRSLGRWKG
jgi:aspartate/methionine/tyrosine aminotransferase